MPAESLVHLAALHDFNSRPNQVEKSYMVSAPAAEVLYLDRKASCSQVLLRVIKVVLHQEEKAMETYAILDDGSERNVLLQAAAKELNLHGEPEQVALRTVCQYLKVLQGMSVLFTISPANQLFRSREPLLLTSWDWQGTPSPSGCSSTGIST